jgi:hemin uptake protein HemP
MICFGFGWRALRKNTAACWLPISRRRRSAASRHYWLRGDVRAVKDETAQFISIVNCSSWIALRSTYKAAVTLNDCKGATTAMSATSGDDTACADTSPPAMRSLTISGNRIDSRDLFSSDREIIIAHGEQAYRLRLTSQNKLILTK